jgi:CRISPR-associated endoribonuclease Cas6
MRIKITLAADKSGIIDFNYQHQIQAIIYGFLSRSNPDYAQWLHQQGFVYQKDKRFKLFVFSGITFEGSIKIIRSNRLNGSNGLNGLSGLNALNSFNNRNGFSFVGSKNAPFTFSFQIASPVDKFIQYLIEGIFHEGNEITIGRQKITIYRIETLPDPLNSLNGLNCSNRLNGLTGLNGSISLTLRPVESPIFIKKPMPSGQRDLYLFPGNEGYEALLNQNLIHKYETLYGKPYDGEPLKFKFQLEPLEWINRFERFEQFGRLNQLERPKQINGLNPN